MLLVLDNPTLAYLNFGGYIGSGGYKIEPNFEASKQRIYLENSS